LAVLAIVALSGCAVDGLAFRVDERVDITSPDDRADVTLPLTISWTADGVEPADDGGPYFAVFVDQPPIRPGQSLRSVADDSCNRTPGCPDLDYFRDRSIYVTETTSVELDVIPQRSGQRTGGDDSHEATIVLVDADGRRIGEAAYTVQFNVEDA
jgi:hypothetical protein